MKKYYLFFALIIVFSVIFTRFYNLKNTAQFAEDEAGFLVRVHQIYVERKITLVGQVNEFGTKVFSSSTVYLLLPFAILGKFDPISIFYGAAFYGVATVIVLLYLLKSIDARLLPFTALVLLFFYPLVRMGRWAWNPNFIPLFVGLALIFYLRGKNWSYFLSGVFFGLCVHQHYYALFSALAFIFIASIVQMFRKNIVKPLLLGAGFTLMLLPFIVFDLRHPPGIFLLGASNQSQMANVNSLLGNFLAFSMKILKYYTQNTLLAIVALFSTAALLFIDLSKERKNLIYFFPIVAQIFFVSLLGSYFPHYFFAIIPFYLVWIVAPRHGGKLFTYIILTCLLLGGIMSIRTQLNKSPVEPNLANVRLIDNILKRQIEVNYLKNANIAALASPDPVTQAEKYRYLLLVPDNLSIASHDEYFSSDYLFVVSTSSEEKVRKDPALEMTNFRKGTLLGSWVAGTGPWRVYLFAKNI